MQNAAIVKTGEKNGVAGLKVKKPYFFYGEYLSVSVEADWKLIDKIFENDGYKVEEKISYLRHEYELMRTYYRGFEKVIMHFNAKKQGEPIYICVSMPSDYLQAYLHDKFSQFKIWYRVSSISLVFYLYQDACIRKIYGDASLDEEWVAEFLTRYEDFIYSEKIFGKWILKVDVPCEKPELEKHGITQLPIAFEEMDYHKFINF